MEWRGTALVVAGMIGSGVAVVHGILLQRRIVIRLEPLLRADKNISGAVGRLVPLLLHFSTFNWFLGGFALIAASLWFGPDVRFAIGVLVGSSYLFGALGNAWGTRGRHPGWILYTLAVGLIVVGIS